MIISKPFLLENELPWEPLNEGVSRQILGYNVELMMVKVSFESGAVGALHSHPHSQSSYVASGKFEVEIDGVKRILEAGDGFMVAQDLVHGVKCLEAGVLLDAFSPLREDFLE
jgi:Uncharacterized conserved protein, contains double-stranded beta-helix domain